MKSNPFGLNKNTPQLSEVFLRDGYSITDKAFPFDEGILI
jgi:hypothetical protein